MPFDPKTVPNPKLFIPFICHSVIHSFILASAIVPGTMLSVEFQQRGSWSRVSLLGVSVLGAYSFGETSLGSKVSLGVSWFLVGYTDRPHLTGLPGTGSPSI